MFGDTPLTIVEDTAALESLVAKLESRPVIGVDIEADSFHHYRERVCLIQVSDVEGDYIIDPLKIEDCASLGRLFDNPDQILILHGGDYDVVSMKRDYGVTCNNIFDTMVAALFLGMPRIGLADLIDRYFGHYIDKKYQRHDWSRRPLLPEHLHYARGDTHFLIALHEVLGHRLRSAGLYEAFQEECELLAQREWSGRGNGPADFLRVKRARSLDEDGKRVLRALWEYRDECAQEIDRPSFKVLPDSIMIELSAGRPQSTEDLSKILRPSSSIARRHGAALLKRIAVGLADERPIPAMPPSRGGGSPRSRTASGIDRLYGPLKEWRNTVVNRRKLNPVVVVSNQQLKDIARAAPASLEALAAVPGVRSWQVKMYGDAILKTIQQVPSGGKRRRKKRTRSRS